MVGLAAVAWPTDASAVCVGPEMTVTPMSGLPGSPFTVSGTYFGDDCIDTGPDPSLGNPETGIELSFVDADGGTHLLGTVDADAAYRFTFPTAVPVEAAAGAARVVTQVTAGDVEAPFTVTDGVIPATPAFTG
jgi:hypothetical protein